MSIISSSGDSNLKLTTLLSYGSGDVACNIVYGMITSLLTLFYTDYAGVPVVTVGLVMLISRFFDGSSDVIMGVIIAHTRSKWGQARPWIIWTSIPYCVAAVMLFAVPQTNVTLQFWYIFVAYNFCTTLCYTAINVPYGTLSTLMTKSSKGQDILSIFRMGMSPCGKIISVTLTLPVVKLFGDDQAAWIKAMLIWAIMAFILLLICFINCKEVDELRHITDNKKLTQEEKAAKKAAKKGGFSRETKALITNQYFWATTILWTITVIHTTIVGTVLPYYCKYLFKNDTWMYSTLYLTEMAVIIIVTFLCPLLLKRFTKKQLSLWGSLLVIVAQAAFMINTNSFVWAFITIFIRSIGEAPLIALVFGMMGDTAIFGEWKSGLRQASLIFGGGSLGFKIGTGLCSAVVTALLGAAGYVSSTTGGIVQPDTALSMIRLIYIWGPIIVWAIAALVLFIYKLDDIMPKITQELEERNRKLAN